MLESLPMDKLKIIQSIFIWGIFLLGVFLVLALLWSSIGFVVSVTRREPTNFTVVLECQKISATATNEGWGYKECVQNLRDSLPKDASLLKII